MNSMRPLILTIFIVIILVVAGFTSLFVLDIVPREDLRDAFGKTLRVLAVAIVAMFAIWGVLKMGNKG